MQDFVGRHICPQCHRRADGPGSCAHCEGIERVDLADGEVRKAALAEARRREEGRRKRIIWRLEVAVVAAAFGVLMLGMFVAGFFASALVYVAAKILALIALTLGWASIERLYARLPRQEPFFFLSPEENQALEGAEQE